MSDGSRTILQTIREGEISYCTYVFLAFLAQLSGGDAS